MKFVPVIFLKKIDSVEFICISFVFTRYTSFNDSAFRLINSCCFFFVLILFCLVKPLIVSPLFCPHQVAYDSRSHLRAPGLSSSLPGSSGGKP